MNIFRTYLINFWREKRRALLLLIIISDSDKDVSSLGSFRFSRKENVSPTNFVESTYSKRLMQSTTETQVSKRAIFCKAFIIDKIIKIHGESFFNLHRLTYTSAFNDQIIPTNSCLDFTWNVADDLIILFMDWKYSVVFTAALDEILDFSF